MTPVPQQSGTENLVAKVTKPQQPHQVGLLTDFNAQNLAVLLQKAATVPGAKCVQAPFGQTIQLLLDENAEFWSETFETLVVWSLPQIAVPEFRRVLALEAFSMEALLAEVDAFCAQVKRAPKKVRTILVASFGSVGPERGGGTLDMVNNVGAANVLMRMNLRLAEQFADDRRIVLLDMQRWLSAAGPGAYNPKLWYMAKTPFHNMVFREAASDILGALDGVHGRNKKVLVLDLDNTLWGGIVGDDGWEKLRIGGHDPVGEAYADFQRGLKRLANRGILLAIASKNEEAVAMQAIRSHPEMVLKLEDFAGWKIDWNDKAANIRELITRLNLGLDSVVFLDDSAFERTRVRETLPQVLVPDLPPDPMEYPTFLANLRCFDNPFISAEDRARTEMYVADRQRVALQTDGRSLQEWLQLLELRVVAEPLSEANLERATQLLNKTNQMNLTTRRLTAPELLAWSRADGNHLWTFRIADRFGDYGLCGIASLQVEGTHAKVVDFLLSCRVMGRGVEETMLCKLAEQADAIGCELLHAEYVATAKNQPCLKWFQNHPKLQREGNSFRLGLLNQLALPAHVQAGTNRPNEEILVSAGS